MDEGKKIVSLLGFEEICTKEIFRESFNYYSILFNIDTWSGLPSYLEIKAIDEMDIYNWLKLLNIDFKNSVGVHKTIHIRIMGLRIVGRFFTEEERRLLKR